MKETAFIGLYKGRSVGDARLVAVSSDREIVAKFFRELVGERPDAGQHEAAAPTLAVVDSDD